MNPSIHHSRRDVVKAAVLVTGAFSLGGLPAFADDAPRELLAPVTTSTPGKDPWKGLKVGVASYSFRKLPLEQTIAGVKRVGLQYVSIKDFHLTMKSTADERKKVAQQFKDAGITPISCGVITTGNDEPSVRQAFEYARDIGAPTIVGNPHPDSLAIVDKFVKQFDVRYAIHNHGPESPHFKSPSDVWSAVEKFDPRIGLCIDVGHTARAGTDPAGAIRKYKDRVYDVHFKDIVALDAKNAGIAEIEVGRGILDIKGMLVALLEIKYAGHVGFEHEKTAENPLPGLAESVGYTKGVLACIGG
ncbi:MAG: sugar phosphate isomerase/epimerase [Phycisphaerales bacterium]|nr:sugar phosphate isomerase/epimerase [Phycisphaerales bacterium]